MKGVELERRPEALSLSDRVRSLRLPEAPAGRPSRAWLPWTLCLVLAVTAAYLGYRAYTVSEPESPRAAEANPSASAAPSGPLAAASSGEVVHESKGYIVPAHQIQVSPKVSGMIIKLRIKDKDGKEVPLEEGQRVRKGDVLAELEAVEYQTDRDHYKAALQEAEQNLLELTQHRAKEIDQAKNRWLEAKVQREQLELDQKRSSRLRGTGLAERDFEQADSAYQAQLRREKALQVDYEFMMKGPRDNRIHAAERRIDQLKADLEKAEWRLENCVVRAPITGTILNKIAEEGNIVNQLSMNLKGSICDMADLSDLEVDLSIQERDIARVFLGQKCRIRSEAYPDHTYEGVVSRLMPIADRAKGSVTTRVKLTVPREEEGVYLKPEMGATVWFLKGPNKDTKAQGTSN
jgi:multidrug resistance efflux pump